MNRPPPVYFLPAPSKNPMTIIMIFVVIVVALGFASEWKFWGLLGKTCPDPTTMKLDSTGTNCICISDTMSFDAASNTCICSDTMVWDATSNTCVCTTESHIYDAATNSCLDPTCPTDATRYAAVDFIHLGDGPYYENKGDGLRTEIHGDYSLPHNSGIVPCGRIVEDSDTEPYLQTGRMKMEQIGPPKCKIITDVGEDETSFEDGFVIMLHKNCDNYTHAAPEFNGANVYTTGDITFIGDRHDDAIDMPVKTSTTDDVSLEQTVDFPFCNARKKDAGYGAWGRWVNDKCVTIYETEGSDEPTTFLDYAA